MFSKHLVVRSEEGTERKALNVRLLLGTGDDLVEETNICP
jgi:hypothetical protein